MKTFPFVFIQGDGTTTQVEAFSKEEAKAILRVRCPQEYPAFKYEPIMTFDAIIDRIKAMEKGKLTGVEFIKADGSVRKSSFNPLWVYKAKGTGTPLSPRQFLFLESFNIEKKGAKKISLFKDRVVKLKINKQEVCL